MTSPVEIYMFPQDEKFKKINSNLSKTEES
jgi:hypothetical protein